MIDIGKTYRTRRGREVRIYATDGGGEFPIHGAVLQEEGWDVESWAVDGRYNPKAGESSYDLCAVEQVAA